MCFDHYKLLLRQIYFRIQVKDLEINFFKIIHTQVTLIMFFVPFEICGPQFEGYQTRCSSDFTFWVSILTRSWSFYYIILTEKLEQKITLRAMLVKIALLCTYRLTLSPMVSWAAATDCFQWWRQVFPWVTPTRPIDFPQAHICQVLVKGRIASGVQQNKVVVIRWASWHDQMQKHIEDAMGSAGSEPNPTDVRKGNC